LNGFGWTFKHHFLSLILPINAKKHTLHLTYMCTILLARNLLKHPQKWCKDANPSLLGQSVQ
jgi:hypothetical protein